MPGPSRASRQAVSCHVTWPLPTSRPLPRMTPPHPAVHVTCRSPLEQLVRPRAVSCARQTHVKAPNYCLLPRGGHEQTSGLPDFSYTNRPIFVLFVKSEWVLNVLFCSSIFCLVACLRPLWASTEPPPLTDHLSGLTVDSQPFSIDRTLGWFYFCCFRKRCSQPLCSLCVWVCIFTNWVPPGRDRVHGFVS